MDQHYTDFNSKAVDGWVEEGWEWGRPISHEAFVKAKNGDWSMLLTPTKPVPKDWFGDLRGKKLLGLASGGGQQMPIFAALGAECTVLDYSEKQLQSEREVAAREGYDINIVRADMTKPLPFPDEFFDFIFHPVSNCFIEDVVPVWRECFRILRKGGVLLAGFDNGINYAFNDEETALENKLPYNPLKDPRLYEDALQGGWGIQFSHTIEDQIGGQLKAGLALTDIFHDTNSAGPLHDFNVPVFYATRAVKP
jgi:SAM-dependent methyltransferase